MIRRWFQGVILTGLASALAIGLGLVVASSADARADDRPLFLGATTSIENSGLLAHLVTSFQQHHDIDVRTVTAGTGAILNLAERGDIDLIFTHAPAAEQAFLDAGHGTDRRLVMENRFVIVGPDHDPANIADLKQAEDAMMEIASSGGLFLSRGDDSGTHLAELSLWRDVGIEPWVDHANWYRESGAGQGATLNIAANLGAYLLTDEATWASFQNRGELVVLHASDDPTLGNLYSIMRVNPTRFPAINVDDAKHFADWLISADGQAAIDAFEIDGRNVFRPCTSGTEPSG